MIDLPPSLTKRLGPLPVWGWGVVGAVGLGGVIYYIRKQNGTSSTTNVSDLVPSTNLGAGTIPSDTGIGSGIGGGGGSDTGSSPITNNYYYTYPAGTTNPVGYSPGDSLPGQPGSVILPSGDSESNPGWNTLPAPTTNPGGVNNAIPNHIAGMVTQTSPSGQTYQVPDIAADYVSQNPPSSDTLAKLAANPNTEQPIPFVTPQTQAVGGGPYWIDIAS